MGKESNLPGKTGYLGEIDGFPKYQNNINCIVLYISIDNVGYEGRDGKGWVGWYGRNGRDKLNRKGGIGRKGWEEGMGR